MLLGTFLLFQLLQPTIYITEDFGSSEFPSAAGRFECLEAADSGSFFKVEGDPLISSSSSSSTNIFSQSPLSQQHGSFRRISNSSSPSSSPSLPTSSRKRAMEQYSLKVIFASVLNKKLEPVRMQFINITEATANVDDITIMTREVFGYQDLVLVHSNLLRIEDSESAQTLSFWRVNSRKVFAVKSQSIPKTDEEVEEGEPSANQIQNVLPSEILEAIGEVKEKLNNTVVEAINEVKEKLNNTVVLSAEEALSVPQVINDCRLGCSINRVFKCMVCHNLSSSNNVTISTCCKQVLGCKSCIDQWFRDEESCLHCREVNGREMSVSVNCFSDILDKCRSMFVEN